MTSDESTRRKLIVASYNLAKSAELRALLGDLPVKVLSLGDLDLKVEVEETGETFAENAALKACAIARATGELTVADDSGLEVEALDGRPGVRSARIAKTDAARISWLLDEMKEVPEGRRAARFVCVVALATPGALIRSWEGTVAGCITHEARGSHGFGYDPLFYHPPSGMTFAEMEPGLKNRVSHRACALGQLRTDLPAILQALSERHG